MSWSHAFTTPDMTSDIKSVLRRRGLEPKRLGNITDTLYPDDNWQRIMETHGQFKHPELLPSNMLETYMEYFGKASFRKMIRLLLRNGRQYVEIDRLSPASGASTESYLTFLERMLLIDRRGTQVRLTREIANLGPSLEHYVAELCERHLRGSAEWGVLLENVPRSGGDYDVLAWLEPSLIYVECKATSRTANIEDRELREYLQRSVELAPDLAILLIDTDEKLDKFVECRINPILRESVDTRAIANHEISLHPDYPGIFFGFSRIYVTNSKKTILSQLQKCLQHYYAHVKGLAMWSKPYLSQESINFTNAPLRQERE